MAPSDSPFEGPTTEHEFEEHLKALIRSAHANGVDVEGGWADRNSCEGAPSWGVEIYEVIEVPQDADTD